MCSASTLQAPTDASLAEAIIACGGMDRLLASACKRFARQPAFSGNGRTITYLELDTLGHRFAAWLLADGRLVQGERIALMLPNVVHYPIALLAAFRSGLVVVNCNPNYTARELRHQLQHSDATALVTTANLLPLVREIRHLTGLRHVIVVEPDELEAEPDSASQRRGEALQEGEEALTTALRGSVAPTTLAPVAPEATALLQYTGGTTGVSKAVILTHRNLVANILQGEYWYSCVLRPGQETVATVVPMYHVFGLMFNCLLMLHFGAHNRLVSHPRDSAQLSDALAPGLTVMTGVNTFFAGLMNQPSFPSLDLSKLRLTVSGGSAVQAAIVDRWQEATGNRITEGYGLSEATAFALSNRADVGFGDGLRPFPLTEVELRNADGRPVARGEVGEVCVRGPQVTRGYWNDDAETALALDADGWLRTGDLGTLDDEGAVAITDRKKDMVIVSGFNVYPNEVEGTLARHPAVLECAVIGVPDDKTGEALKAFIVLREDGATVDDLIRHCRASLVPYKVPRLYAFTDSLPKTPVGKILRRQLHAS